MNARRITLSLLIFALSAVLGGAQAQSTPARSGPIAIAGSSTVKPVTDRMVALYQQQGFSGNITNDSIGTGGGFERFCYEATSDIANASRPIDADEAEACRAIGRDPLEFQVAIDALVVTVSASNTFVDSLTMEQLAEIYSGRAATWNALNPAWPNEPIYTYSPGTDSGTFDYFVEEVLENDPRPIVAVRGIQFSEDDVVLVTAIENNPYAIGYFGYAYYYPERGRLRALNINDVEPNEHNAQSGDYPLSRPLFIYSARSVMAEKRQVGDFVRFYLQNVAPELGTGINQVGYFPVSDETLAANLATLERAIGR